MRGVYTIYCRRLVLLLIAFVAAYGEAALAHDIGGKDRAFVASIVGPAPGPFLYLGAKHMVTGYDHLLFLLGIIFFLSSYRNVLLYVSLFSLGHSLTLLTGVLFDFGMNSYLVDAAIGLSVVYKAFDNLGGFTSLFRFRPDPRLVIFAFGLVHGLGLATKLIQLRLNHNGLIANLISFNVGVEIGQILALSAMLMLIALWRKTRFFDVTATAANWVIMMLGFILIGYQLAGYYLAGA